MALPTPAHQKRTPRAVGTLECPPGGAIRVRHSRGPGQAQGTGGRGEGGSEEAADERTRGRQGCREMHGKKRSSLSTRLKRSIGAAGATSVDLRGKELGGDEVVLHVEEALRQKGSRKLHGLDLRENALGHVPEALLAMPHFVTLARLNVDSNALAALPDVLGTLANLRVLSARANRFTSVPPCVLQVPPPLSPLSLSLSLPSPPSL